MSMSIDDVLFIRRLMDRSNEHTRENIEKRLTHGVLRLRPNNYFYKNELFSFCDKLNSTEDKDIINHNAMGLNILLTSVSINTIIHKDNYLAGVVTLVRFMKFEDLSIPKIKLEENTRLKILRNIKEYKNKNRKNRVIYLSDFLRVVNKEEYQLTGKYIYCIDFLAIVSYYEKLVELIPIDSSGAMR